MGYLRLFEVVPVQRPEQIHSFLVQQILLRTLALPLLAYSKILLMHQLVDWFLIRELVQPEVEAVGTALGSTVGHLVLQPVHPALPIIPLLILLILISLLNFESIERLYLYIGLGLLRLITILHGLLLQLRHVLVERHARYELY